MKSTTFPPPTASDHRDAQSTVPVCHVSMTLATGGLERLLVDYSRLSDAARFQPRFVALEQLGPPADDIRNHGCAVDSLRFGEVGKLTMLQQLAALLRDEQIRVVHTHNTYAHFYGAIAAKMAGVPVVVNTQHGLRCGQTWKHRLQFRIANRLTQRIVAVSEDAARLCREVDPRSARKIICLWNGIDLERFTYCGPRVDSDRLTAISVARLSPEKDFPTLLRATAQVVREVPQFRLLLVGDGVERPRLEALTDELGLRGHVEFLGERQDVPQLLATAGFFVSSSRIEGISLTLLEASAVGLPIVATAVGGNPEVVDDGRTGCLVPAEDAAALANAMTHMCRNRDAWMAMGELGRQRVEEHFEIRRMIRDYETLYATLLNEQGLEPR